jgi:hypothetical protein
VIAAVVGERSAQLERSVDGGGARDPTVHEDAHVPVLPGVPDAVYGSGPRRMIRSGSRR